MEFNLRAKLALIITILMALTAAFVWTFFPGRIETFARRGAERRATGMAVVLASALQAGVEFDDADGVRELLARLARLPDVQYAVVRRGNGTTLAAWNPDRVPRQSPVPGDEPTVLQGQSDLQVTTRVLGKAGASGSLSVGFSLRELEIEKEEIRRLVTSFAGVLFAIGLGLSVILGTLTARPVRRVTEVARRIAQGDLDQDDLPAGGSDEIGVMSRSFNQMLRSLKGVAASADRIASGDLTVQLDMQGQVAEAFNRMVAGQREIVAQLAQTAHSLGAAASQIYASAQSQESAAGQQSAGVVEVSQTMASLAGSATHIAESARGVLSTAERTKQTADETASRIAQLSGLTNRIAELLEVIRDIADRSDLLALNASLEATRAGEAGRSFALVAGEMRRLAERVTATVGDVKSLVGDIRTSGATTVLSMEEGRKLAEGTTESARIITEVTQHQRVATAQASESMRSIATLLRQSAEASVQTRSSAELLKGQADRLTEIVGRFRLSADAEPVRSAEPSSARVARVPGQDR